MSTPLWPYVRNDEEYLALISRRGRTDFRIVGHGDVLLQKPRETIVRTERGPGTWVDRDRRTGEVVARSDQ